MALAVLPAGACGQNGHSSGETPPTGNSFISTLATFT